MMNKWITIGLLFGFIGVSLAIRIYYPYDSVFSDEGIKISSRDGYYYMRLVDNIAHNFPHLTKYDPYFAYPDGIMVRDIHGFAWLLGGTAWVLGLGNPSSYLVNMVGLYVPPILGALLVIPVYVIGRKLFGHWVGLVGSFMVVILGGELMGRSILGFADHHIMETLLSTTCIMLFILALKAKGKRIWIYSGLAGVVLGLYLRTWVGGMLLVMMFCLFITIQYIVSHNKKELPIGLFKISTIMMFVSYIIYSNANVPVGLYLAMIFAVVLPILK